MDGRLADALLVNVFGLREGPVPGATEGAKAP